MENNQNLKKLIELSSITDLYIFTKKNSKENWILKDKRVLLKECNIKKKNKIKEMKNNINLIDKNKSININDTHNLLNDVKNINHLITTIENEYPDNDLIEKFSN